jgi:undecaprenyl-diphosphatase
MRGTSERFLTRPGRTLWFGIALLVLVGLMALALPAQPLTLDRRWSEAMLDVQTSFLTHLALVFNWLGLFTGHVLVLGGIGLVLVARRRWSALVAFAIAEAAASLLSASLKAAVGRPRPAGGLVHPVGSSFPSGHTTYAAATCVAAVLLFTAPGARRVWWSALALIGMAGMAWSRTYLQAHWLSDVIGGALLGSGVALVVFAAAQLAAQAARRSTDSSDGTK